jgi:hypothetical protein
MHTFIDRTGRRRSHIAACLKVFSEDLRQLRALETDTDPRAS